MRFVAVSNSINFSRTIKQDPDEIVLGFNQEAKGLEHKELLIE